jgi:hypothetical protein
VRQRGLLAADDPDDLVLAAFDGVNGAELYALTRSELVFLPLAFAHGGEKRFGGRVLLGFGLTSRMAPSRADVEVILEMPIVSRSLKGILEQFGGPWSAAWPGAP